MLKIIKEERNYWLNVLQTNKNRLLERVARENLRKINILWNKWANLKKKGQKNE